MTTILDVKYSQKEKENGLGKEGKAYDLKKGDGPVDMPWNTMSIGARVRNYHARNTGVPMKREGRCGERLERSGVSEEHTREAKGEHVWGGNLVSEIYEGEGFQVQSTMNCNRRKGGSQSRRRLEQ